MARRKQPAISDGLLDQLLAGADPKTAFAKDGLLDELKKAFAERALNAEIDHHLDNGEEDGRPNSRNGYGRKSVLTETGKIELEVPRDRLSTFDPQLIAKYQRRFPGFDEKIVSMYARGMSAREIQGHLRDLYGVDVSADLVSAVTDAVLDEIAEWQNRCALRFLPRACRGPHAASVSFSIISASASIPEARQKFSKLAVIFASASILTALAGIAVDVISLFMACRSSAPTPATPPFAAVALPRAARRNVGGFRPDGGNPFLHGLGDELRAIVGTNVLRDATQDEEIREQVDDVDGFQLPGDTNGQTFMCELVDHVEHPVFLAFMRAILDEVVGPDMVRPLGAKTDAGSVREPKPAALGLFGGNFQPLAPPDPFDPFVVHDPAGGRS